MKLPYKQQRFVVILANSWNEKIKVSWKICPVVRMTTKWNEISLFSFLACLSLTNKLHTETNLNKTRALRCKNVQQKCMSEALLGGLCVSAVSVNLKADHVVFSHTYHLLVEISFCPVKKHIYRYIALVILFWLETYGNSSTRKRVRMHKPKYWSRQGSPWALQSTCQQFVWI